MKKRACGIYAIRHRESGKVYIGSSIDIALRWRVHRSQLNCGKHHSRFLQRAWSKYGEGAFVFELVEEVADQAGLPARETWHIEAAGSADGRRGYNMAPVGGSTRGIKLGPMPEETRRKIASSHMGIRPNDAVRKRLSESRKSWKFTDAHRAAMSERMTGRQPTTETRQKLSESARNISAETRRKRSESMILAFTPELRKSRSENARSISDETRRKRSESVRLSWEARREKLKQG